MDLVLPLLALGCLSSFPVIKDVLQKLKFERIERSHVLQMLIFINMRERKI